MTDVDMEKLRNKFRMRKRRFQNPVSEDPKSESPPGPPQENDRVEQIRTVSAFMASMQQEIDDIREGRIESKRAELIIKERALMLRLVDLQLKYERLLRTAMRKHGDPASVLQMVRKSVRREDESGEEKSALLAPD